MDLIFELGGDMTLVRVSGNNILFSTSDSNFQQYSPIDRLRLSRDGILKEFPDLKRKNLSDGDLRGEAIKRFKEKIRGFETEDEVRQYLIEEFEGMGYLLREEQKRGWRKLRY